MKTKKIGYIYITDDHLFTITYTFPKATLMADHSVTEYDKEKIYDYFKATYIHFDSKKELLYNLENFYLAFNLPMPELNLKSTIYNVDNKYQLEKTFSNKKKYWSASYLKDYQIRLHNNFNINLNLNALNMYFNVSYNLRDTKAKAIKQLNKNLVDHILTYEKDNNNLRKRLKEFQLVD